MNKPHLINDELPNRAKCNAATTHTGATIFKLLQTELNHSKIQTHNRQLAEHLKTLFAISDGRDIVPFIGSGKEKNNLEALTTWVASQELGVEAMDFAQQLEALAQELQRTLDRAIERFKRY